MAASDTNSSLYFLAWITGSSDDVLHEGFVETSPENDRKLVSIAQDILYLSSRGTIGTRKNLALGMTIRLISFHYYMDLAIVFLIKLFYSMIQS